MPADCLWCGPSLSPRVHRLHFVSVRVRVRVRIGIGLGSRDNRRWYDGPFREQAIAVRFPQSVRLVRVQPLILQASPQDVSDVCPTCDIGVMVVWQVMVGHSFFPFADTQNS